MVEKKTAGRPLKGMKEICQYVGFSEATVLTLIQGAKFPAKKTKGAAGTWVSNTASIDRWTVGFCEEERTN